MAVNPLRVGQVVAKNPHGKLWEAKAAKVLGAKLTPGSGSQAHSKGDMRVHDYLIESKSTTSASLPIQLGWLVKVTEEAQAKGLTPALLMAFVLPTGRPKPNCESVWVAVPLAHWQELTEGE